MIESSSTAFVLTLVVVVAVVYLLLLRFMDVNEREPFWALGMALLAGAAAAFITRAFVGSPLLELNSLGGSAVRVVGMLVAFLALLAGLSVAARLRGFSEFHGLMDGLVYGMAVGLGYATGEVFFRQLIGGGAIAAFTGVGRLDTLWTTLLLGLREGVTGAIVGAGFGVAATIGRRDARVAAPVLAAGAAILVRWGYLAFARGGSLTQAWIVLLIPLILVVAVALVALSRERRAIREHLREEVDGGIVTEEELRALRSYAVRRVQHARRFFARDFDGWLALRTLHARQVQLALAKQQLARTADPDASARAGDELARLREAVVAARAQFTRVADDLERGEAR